MKKTRRTRQIVKKEKSTINVPISRTVRKYLSTVAWGQKAYTINAILENYIRKSA